MILRPWCSSIKQNMHCLLRAVSSTISASRPRSLPLVGVCVWKSCEEYVKTMWEKTETMWNKSWRYYSIEIGMHVKFSECKWKLFWNVLFYTCECFSHMWISFSLHVKFSCAYNFFLTCTKQFCSVYEIFPYVWKNNFVLHVKFFTHAKQSCYTCEIFPWTWTSCYVIFFSHMGNSFVIHVNFSKHVNTVKVDGTSFPYVESLVTTAHVSREFVREI